MSGIPYINSQPLTKCLQNDNLILSTSTCEENNDNLPKKQSFHSQSHSIIAPQFSSPHPHSNYSLKDHLTNPLSAKYSSKIHISPISTPQTPQEHFITQPFGSPSTTSFLSPLNSHPSSSPRPLSLHSTIQIAPSPPHLAFPAPFRPLSSETQEILPHTLLRDETSSHSQKKVFQTAAKKRAVPFDKGEQRSSLLEDSTHLPPEMASSTSIPFSLSVHSNKIMPVSGKKNVSLNEEISLPLQEVREGLLQEEREGTNGGLFHGERRHSLCSEENKEKKLLRVKQKEATEYTYQGEGTLQLTGECDSESEDDYHSFHSFLSSSIFPFSLTSPHLGLSLSCPSQPTCTSTCNCPTLIYRSPPEEKILNIKELPHPVTLSTILQHPHAFPLQIFTSSMQSINTTILLFTSTSVSTTCFLEKVHTFLSVFNGYSGIFFLFYNEEEDKFHYLSHDNVVTKMTYRQMNAFEILMLSILRGMQGEKKTEDDNIITMGRYGYLSSTGLIEDNWDESSYNTFPTVKNTFFEDIIDPSRKKPSETNETQIQPDLTSSPDGTKNSITAPPSSSQAQFATHEPEQVASKSVPTLNSSDLPTHPGEKSLLLNDSSLEASKVLLEDRAQDKAHALLKEAQEQEGGTTVKKKKIRNEKCQKSNNKGIVEAIQTHGAPIATNDIPEKHLLTAIEVREGLCEKDNSKSKEKKKPQKEKVKNPKNDGNLLNVISSDSSGKDATIKEKERCIEERRNEEEEIRERELGVTSIKGEFIVRKDSCFKCKKSKELKQEAFGKMNRLINISCFINEKAINKKKIILALLDNFIPPSFFSMNKPGEAHPSNIPISHYTLIDENTSTSGKDVSHPKNLSGGESLLDFNKGFLNTNRVNNDPPKPLSRSCVLSNNTGNISNDVDKVSINGKNTVLTEDMGSLSSTNTAFEASRASSTDNNVLLSNSAAYVSQQQGPLNDNSTNRIPNTLFRNNKCARTSVAQRIHRIKLDYKSVMYQEEYKNDYMSLARENNIQNRISYYILDFILQYIRYEWQNIDPILTNIKKDITLNSNTNYYCKSCNDIRRNKYDNSHYCLCHFYHQCLKYIIYHVIDIYHKQKDILDRYICSCNNDKSAMLLFISSLFKLVIYPSVVEFLLIDFHNLVTKYVNAINATLDFALTAYRRMNQVTYDKNVMPLSTKPLPSFFSGLQNYKHTYPFEMNGNLSISNAFQSNPPHPATSFNLRSQVRRKTCLGHESVMEGKITSSPHPVIYGLETCPPGYLHSIGNSASAGLHQNSALRSGVNSISTGKVHNVDTVINGNQMYFEGIKRGNSLIEQNSHSTDYSNRIWQNNNCAAVKAAEYKQANVRKQRMCSVSYPIKADHLYSHHLGESHLLEVNKQLQREREIAPGLSVSNGQTTMPFNAFTEVALASHERQPQKVYTILKDSANVSNNGNHCPLVQSHSVTATTFDNCSNTRIYDVQRSKENCELLFVPKPSMAFLQNQTYSSPAGSYVTKNTLSPGYLHISPNCVPSSNPLMSPSHHISNNNKSYLPPVIDNTKPLMINRYIITKHIYENFFNLHRQLFQNPKRNSFINYMTLITLTKKHLNIQIKLREVNSNNSNNKGERSPHENDVPQNSRKRVKYADSVQSPLCHFNNQVKENLKSDRNSQKTLPTENQYMLGPERQGPITLKDGFEAGTNLEQEPSINYTHADGETLFNRKRKLSACIAQEYEVMRDEEDLLENFTNPSLSQNQFINTLSSLSKQSDQIHYPLKNPVSTNLPCNVQETQKDMNSSRNMNDIYKSNNQPIVALEKQQHDEDIFEVYSKNRLVKSLPLKENEIDILPSRPIITSTGSGNGVNGNARCTSVNASTKLSNTTLEDHPISTQKIHSNDLGKFSIKGTESIAQPVINEHMIVYRKGELQGDEERILSITAKTNSSPELEVLTTLAAEREKHASDTLLDSNQSARNNQIHQNSFPQGDEEKKELNTSDLHGNEKPTGKRQLLEKKLPNRKILIAPKIYTLIYTLDLRTGRCCQYPSMRTCAASKKLKASQVQKHLMGMKAIFLNNGTIFFQMPMRRKLFILFNTAVHFCNILFDILLYNLDKFCELDDKVKLNKMKILSEIRKEFDEAYPDYLFQFVFSLSSKLKERCFYQMPSLLVPNFSYSPPKHASNKATSPETIDKPVSTTSQPQTEINNEPTHQSVESIENNSEAVPSKMKSRKLAATADSDIEMTQGKRGSINQRARKSSRSKNEDNEIEQVEIYKDSLNYLRWNNDSELKLQRYLYSSKIYCHVKNNLLLKNYIDISNYDTTQQEKIKRVWILYFFDIIKKNLWGMSHKKLQDTYLFTEDIIDEHDFYETFYSLSDYPSNFQYFFDIKNTSFLWYYLSNFITSKNIFITILTTVLPIISNSRKILQQTIIKVLNKETKQTKNSSATATDSSTPTTLS